MTRALIVSALVGLSLSGCSGDEDSRSSILSGVDKVASAQNLEPSNCAHQTAFEDLAFDRKCWSRIVSTQTEAGDIGLALGLGIQDAYGGVLEIIKSSDSGIVARNPTQTNCADYVVAAVHSPEKYDVDKMPIKIELEVAATKTPHCGELSKPYPILQQ
jgi:hypothetical protein